MRNTFAVAVAGMAVFALGANAPAPTGFTLPAMWEYTTPLISPAKRAEEPSRAQKDPTVVFHDGRWHLFMTVKLPDRSAIEYCSFARWEDADQAPRTILKISDSKYFCAPQVFYFTPHKKWYLVYQVGIANPDKKKRKGMWVAYSTTSDIARPDSWTQAQPILDGEENDPRLEGGLDYWIICDDQRAYLFFTSLNGKMWRLWTRLADFPQGFGHCEIALQAAFFEASHTYRLKGSNKYLTIIEENGRRYYKAYLADRLDGPWTPLADTADRPFAGWKNIRPAQGVEAWTDNVSHGELIRDSNDQTLTVDPANLKFVFQGMLETEKAGKGYGQFPWRIGMLTPIRPALSELRAAAPPNPAAADPWRKIELDLQSLDPDGLRGPADGKVAVSYEFAIPNTDACKTEVKAIDPTVQFMPGSQGRIRAPKTGCLCIGSTHQAGYRDTLRKLAALPYVERIIECHFE